MSSDSEYVNSDLDYSDIDEREAEEEEYDSDEELQRAFAEGKLQPGLHSFSEKPAKKEFKNDVDGLKKKLEEFQLKLPWIERLDLTNDAAMMAPELETEILEHKQTRERRMKSQTKHFNIDVDPVHNDFVREMNFYRQAQGSVIEGFKRLKAANLPTARPGDYFAQMAKSDEHMQKVRRRLMKKQIGQKLSEKVKKIREIKKYGKKVQIEVEQQKHKQKREMLDKISKFRKGKTDSIDFLDGGAPLRNRDGSTHKSKGKKFGGSRAGSKKQQGKDMKYGSGGRKRGLKRNDAKSHAQSFNTLSVRKQLALANKAKRGGRKGKNKASRPGKNRRKGMRK